MLVTVALVACLVGGLAAQDLSSGRGAFKQLMSGCLGDASYRDYLNSVATARRECGGGVDEQGFFPGLANVFLSPAARFPPVHGTPLLQSGTAVLQRPPGVSQLPGVFTQSRGIPQQSGIFPQQPGVFSSQPGILQHPGTFFQQPQFITQQPGVVTSQPGTLPQESGIFSSVLDSQSRVTPVGITDSVPAISSPVGPTYPGIRQKRTVALNLADIQKTRENMYAQVNNFTCILTKLAVVNNNLDLNYPGLTNSVVSLPVARELKRDLLQSINYCRDLTQCLPLDNLQLPVPHKLKRIMNYVKCEKEMRLKACHKHKLRQNLQNINLGRLPHDGNQFNTVEEVVTLLVDAHELELI